MSEERYCSNCRVELPKGAAVCPACGVYAGDVFDGRLPRVKRSYGTYIIVVLAVIAIFALATLFVRWPVPIFNSAPPRAHAIAPRAKKLPGEAGAMLAVRQRLVSDQIPNECLVLLSKGLHDGAYVIRAVDRCRHHQLGEWKVDARTRKISRM
ncbi:MAG TPA: zinc ribbon domain-containing protein [Thermoanaerobaculia bacterium]|nr:zinc ribbon domain-containing protein [Thermoanaerobaculia bacterium]